MVVIFDHMMDQILASRKERAGIFSQSKVEKLATHLDAEYEWAKHGCLADTTKADISKKLAKLKDTPSQQKHAAVCLKMFFNCCN